MPRPFLHNVGFLLALNLLIKPVFIFGIDLVVQNRVGPEAYGFYFALFNFAFLFNVLLDFGINNFNQRLIARDPKRVAVWLPNIILVKALLAIAFYAAVFAVALGLRFDADQMRLLVWLSLNRVLISFHMYFRSNVSGLQAFRTDAVLSILDRGLTILVVGALLYTEVLGRAFTVQDFVYATTFSLTLTALGSFAALRKLSGPIRPAWNGRLLRVVLQRAYPFALLGVLMTIYNRVDGVMLERLLGENGDLQAGIYAAAYRLLDAGTMFAFLISGILLPLFARMRKEGQNVWPVAQASWRLLLVVSITAAVLSAVHAEALMRLLYTEADAYWGATFAWLMPGFVFNATVYVFGSLLTAENRLRGLNRIAVLGVVGNVLLNVLLIPRYQALGAAYATLLTQGLVAVAHLVFTARVFQWPKRLSGEAFRGLGFALLLLALVLGLEWAVGPGLPEALGGAATGATGGAVDPGIDPALDPTAAEPGQRVERWSWWLRALFAGGVAVLAAWIFGLLNPRELLRARAEA
jgi:O-antigen/teichoic acid export membrane protein